MVRADGLMLVGERQSRETVIQDCNSYIKVFETCHLLCVFQMPCLFNVDTENIPELLKRDLCKCKLFAELFLYKNRDLGYWEVSDKIVFLLATKCYRLDKV